MGRWRWLLLLFIALPLAAALPIYVLREDRRVEVRLRLRELDRIEQECRKMKARNQELARQVRSMDDPRYLEKAVRSELGWVRPGELVFHFRMPSNPVPSTGGKSR